MGPLLFTGLACFGGAVAIGLVAASTSRPVGVTGEAAASRGLAIVLMAFAQGIAVLGVVIGLLAVTLGAVRDPAGGLLAAGPAVAGAVVGIGLIVRRAASSDAQVSIVAAMFIVGMAVLGIVVALLGVFIVEVERSTLSDWPFVILGFASGASAIAIGVTGTRTVPKMTGADDQTRKALQSAQISRIVPFEAIAVGCSGIGILLVVVD